MRGRRRDAGLWRGAFAAGLGRIVVIDDSGPVQRGQVRLSVSELRDAMPILGQFGFQSNPPPGSDVAYLGLEAQRSKSVVVASNHQASRLRGLASGGARQHDAGGRQVLIDNDGLIAALAPGETLHRLITEIAVAVFNGHTHVCHGTGSSTGVPEQALGDAHLTGAFRAGT